MDTPSTKASTSDGVVEPHVVFEVSRSEIAKQEVIIDNAGTTEFKKKAGLHPTKGKKFVSYFTSDADDAKNWNIPTQKHDLTDMVIAHDIAKTKRASAKTKGGKKGRRGRKKLPTWDSLYSSAGWGTPPPRTAERLKYLTYWCGTHAYEGQWIVCPTGDVAPKTNEYLRFIKKDIYDTLFKVLKDVKLPFYARMYDDYPD